MGPRILVSIIREKLIDDKAEKLTLVIRLDKDNTRCA